MSPILSELVPSTSTEFTATLVVSGIVIVVGILFLLILVFSVFGKLVSGAEARAKKKSKKDDAPKKQEIPMPVVPAPKPVVEDGISGEVVAAIAAAVAMTEGSGAVVRSIKRRDVGSRNPWAQAAQINNTKSF